MDENLFQGLIPVRTPLVLLDAWLWGAGGGRVSVRVHGCVFRFRVCKTRSCFAPPNCSRHPHPPRSYFSLTWVSDGTLLIVGILRTKPQSLKPRRVGATPPCRELALRPAAGLAGRVMRWATLTPDPQTSPKHSARSFPVAGCVPSLTCLGCGGLLRTEEQSGSGQHFISGVF